MIGGTGPVALKMPVSGERARRSRNSARSRVSIAWNARASEAGTIISPPRAARCAHHGNRPVWSYGPITNPGRTIAARSPNDLGHDPLAQHLQPAVGAAADLLRRLVLQRRERPVLVLWRGEAGVDGDRRDEDVSLDAVAQRTRGVADEPRDVARHVEAGVPAAAVERAEAAVAVADDVLDLREDPGVRAAAVEQRRLVAGSERRLDERAADELGAAENEDLHTSSATPARRRSTSSSVL